MAGSTFQPPINLDPNQDSGQQTAFINQNFQSLAAALETNSFRIVKTGSTSTPAISLGDPGAGNFNSLSAYSTVTHNLGYIPVVICFIDRGTSYELMPSNSANGSGISARWYSIYPTVDATTLTISFDVTVFHQSFTLAAGAFPIKYFLLQQTTT